MLQTVTQKQGERASPFLRFFRNAFGTPSARFSVGQSNRLTESLKYRKGSSSRRNALPLYEYRCTACGHKFEKIQKFSDEPLLSCPLCQGELVRPMTAPALRFEGAGWYVNDYAGKGAAKSGDAPAAADAAAKDTKADSKPATESSPTPTATAAPAAAPASAPAASTAS